MSAWDVKQANVMPDVNDVQLSPEPVVVDTTPAVDAATKVEPGSKTPPELLLKSLQEEREARRKLEERLTLLESSNSSDVFSDEGKVLQKRIEEQDSKIETLLQDNAKKDVLIRYPDLKDKWNEIEEFRNLPENKGMNLNTSVKAYLVENGLFEPKRKGLEKTTGGPRVPVSTEMSAEDVKKLRENDFKKYQEMLMKGQLPKI